MTGSMMWLLLAMTLSSEDYSVESSILSVHGSQQACVEASQQFVRVANVDSSIHYAVSSCTAIKLSPETKNVEGDHDEHEH